MSGAAMFYSIAKFCLFPVLKGRIGRARAPLVQQQTTQSFAV